MYSYICGCQCMIPHKGNKPHLSIRDNLFSCEQPHQQPPPEGEATNNTVY